MTFSLTAPRRGMQTKCSRSTGFAGDRRPPPRQSRSPRPAGNPMNRTRISILSLGVLLCAATLLFIPFEGALKLPQKAAKNQDLGYHFIWSPPSESVCRQLHGIRHRQGACNVSPSISRALFSFGSAATLLLGTFGLLAAAGATASENKEQPGEGLASFSSELERLRIFSDQYASTAKDIAAGIEWLAKCDSEVPRSWRVSSIAVLGRLLDPVNANMDAIEATKLEVSERKDFSAAHGREFSLDSTRRIKSFAISPFFQRSYSRVEDSRKTDVLGGLRHMIFESASRGWKKAERGREIPRVEICTDYDVAFVHFGGMLVLLAVNRRDAAGPWSRPKARVSIDWI